MTDAPRVVAPDAAAMLAARYGTGPRPWWLRVLRAGGVVLAGLALTVGAWRAWQLTDPTVTSQLLGFEVVSPARVDLALAVGLPSGGTGTCVLRAQDASRHDVGYATIAVGPPAAADGTRVLGTYALATRAEAVIAEVLGCAAGSTPPQVAPPQFPPGTANPPQAPALSPDGAISPSTG